MRPRTPVFIDEQRHGTGSRLALMGLRPCDPSKRETLLTPPRPFPSLTSLCGHPRRQGSSLRSDERAKTARP